MKKIFSLLVLILTISNAFAQLTITDNQGGDDAWRKSNNGTYDIDFMVSGSNVLSYFQTRVCSTPGGCTTPLEDWTTVVSGINAYSYTTNWSLLASTWSVMLEDTNYVSVRIYDNMGNFQTLNDAFYVKKDTTPPITFMVNDGPGVDIVYTNSTSQMDVNWDVPSDALSGIAWYAFAIGTTSGGSNILGWTGAGNIYPYPNNKLLITGLTLTNGLTYYVSIKAYDGAGNSTYISSSGQTVNTSLTGMNFAGADWTIAENSEISGVFTNINTFTIPAGVYVYVAPYNGSTYGKLEITASNISIEGTINADGKGYRGGGASASGAPNGGAGGGYGGAGQSSYAWWGGFVAGGGVSYGTASNTDIAMGSGGGGNTNGEGTGGGGGSYAYNASTGGRGGGYIKLVAANNINISSTGALSANGWDALNEASKSGAGSGGGIYLEAPLGTTMNGLISANGGGASGGCGGGGGRVKIFGCRTINGTITVNKGGGASNGTINQSMVVMSNTNVSCHGKNDGTATANVIGCAAPYTFSWNTTPVQTTPTATGLTAGTYSVTVTDATLFSDIATVVITEPAVGAITSTNVTCHGASDGTASALAVGCTAPNTYIWSTNPVQNTVTATGLSAGTYTVTVTSEGNLLPNIASVVITEPAIGAITFTGVSCYGGSDGTANAAAVGCAAPNTYTWSTTPVQTTAIATGLTAGTYTVTVTSAGNLLPNIASVEVTQPSPSNITVSSQPSDAWVCPNTDANFSVAVTGTTPFTYIWQYNNGGTWVNAVDGIPAGAIYSSLGTATMAVKNSNEGIFEYRCCVSNLCGADTSETASLSTIADGLWSGAYDYNWNNASNWCSGTVPTASTNVIIPANTPNMPIITTPNAVCSSLLNYGMLRFEAPGKLVCSENIINNYYIIVEMGGILNSGSITNNNLMFVRYNNSTLTTTGDFNSYQLYIEDCQVVCGGNFTNNYDIGVSSCGNFKCNGNINSSGNLNVHGGGTINCLGNASFNNAHIQSGHFIVEGTVTGSLFNSEGVYMHPSSLSGNSAICTGTNTSLLVNATGGMYNAIAYQWQFSIDGGNTWVNLSNGGVYSNVNTATLNITGALNNMNNNQYRCEVWHNISYDYCPVFSKPVTLKVNDPIIPDAGSDVTICNGSETPLNATGGTDYSWSPATGLSATHISNPMASPSVSTTYSVALNNNGCIASDTVVVTVNPAYSINNSQMICNGETYIFNGHTYSITGNYNDTLQTILGCDSIIITQLTVNPTYSINNPQQICMGGSYSINGHTYTATGSYIDTLQAVNGCDSIIATQLTVNPTYSFITNQSICSGTVYNWQGSDYNTSGNFTISYNSIFGCDSIYSLNLIVNPIYSFTEYDTIYNYETLLWHGTTYNTSGTFTKLYTTSDGCDSLFTLHLTQIFNINQFCDWSYINKVTINNTNNPATLTDYSVLIKINTAALIASGKMKADGSDIRFTIDNFNNLSYWIDSGIQNEYGMNRDSTHIWVKVPVIAGSSSTIINMYYGNPLATGLSNIGNTFLFGDDFNDNSLDASKWDVVYDNFGHLNEQNQRLEHNSPRTTPQSNSNLYSKQAFTGTIALEFQFKKGGYIYRGAGLNKTNGNGDNRALAYWQDWGPFGANTTVNGVSTGVQFRSDSWSNTNNPEYYVTIIHNADSTFSYYEKVPSIEPGGPLSWSTTISDKKMPLDSSLKFYAYDGVWGVSSLPRYEDNVRIRKYSKPEPFTILSAEAEVKPIITTNAEICTGEIYHWQGNDYSTTGIQNVVFTSHLKCDSTQRLNLVVNPVFSTNNPQTICSGESYIFNGHAYTATGSYKDTLQTVSGCDSIIITQLTVNPIFSTNNPQTICSGESFIFNGHAYTATGSYNDTLQTVLGCDSIIITQLTVNPVFSTNNPQTICSGESYIFNGHAYTATGSYNDTLQTVLGCDSIIITQLTVNPVFSNNNPQTICSGESYIFNGHAYTATGSYNDTLQTVLGCDSIIITQLTVNPVFSTNNPQTICSGESYTFNGHTYTATGSYNDTLQTVLGCDSIIITQLTVNPVFSTNNPQTICSGESYTFNGHVYTATGSYNDTLQTVLGCDSIIVTNLIVYSLPITPSITQNGDTLISNSLTGNQWYNSSSGLIAGATDQQYMPTQTGSYYVVVTDSNGCSSLISNSIYFINTDIANSKSNRTFEIYPNPANNQITVITANDNQQNLLSVFNINGKVLIIKHIEKNTTEIDVSTLPSGVYFVKIVNNTGVDIGKFIKE